jgi:hypothetical protein
MALVWSDTPEIDPGMSKLHRDHDEEAHQVFKVPGEQDVCFHCGESLTYPLICWAGMSSREGWDGRIFFHPVCAARWVMAFVRDIHELHHQWDVKDVKPPRL